MMFLIYIWTGVFFICLLPYVRIFLVLLEASYISQNWIIKEVGDIRSSLTLIFQKLKDCRHIMGTVGAIAIAR